MITITTDNPAETLASFAAVFVGLMVLFWVLCRG